MAAHLLQHPAGGPYTTTVTLNPALVTIQEERIDPAQRFLETKDKTHYVFAISANRGQTYEAIVEHLHEDDTASESGYTTLKTFFDTTTNWMINTFDLTHDDGGTITVRIVQESWEFTEGLKGRWSGRFQMRKVI